MTAHGKPDGAAGPLHAPIGEVLARVGHELRQLSGRLGHVETLVGPLLLAAARRDAHLVRQIQDLDHIRQQVEALADFIAALALVAPGQLLVDASVAARFVTLADLANRLTLSAAGGGDRADWDDCELF